MLIKGGLPVGEGISAVHRGRADGILNAAPAGDPRGFKARGRILLEGQTDVLRGENPGQGLFGFEGLDFDFNHDRQFTPRVQKDKKQFQLFLFD